MTSRLLALGFLAACGGGPEERPPYEGPGALQFDGPAPNNLLFLSIDTLRRDHVGALGAPADHTPFLDRIAAEGVLLTDFRQCSGWTMPGTACALAGRTNLERGHAPRLASPEPTAPVEGPLLADWLGEAGFWTGLVSANLWLSPETGGGAGYAFYEHPLGNAEAVRDVGLRALRRERAKKDRWFLHLHHMEPHYPYTPDPSQLVGYDALEPFGEDLLQPQVMETWREDYERLDEATQELLDAHVELIYDAEVRTLDARLEGTWAELEAEGWLDDTLVVIWSDHGEQLWDHGWKGHAHSLYADENDAMAIFWAANLKPAVVDMPTGAIDLAPSVLTALGVPVPEEVTGSLVGTADPERPWFAEILAYGGVKQSVSVGEDKLIYSWTGGLERYERGPDPSEKRDLFSPGDARAAELWSLLEPKVQALDGLTADTPVPPDLEP